MELRRIVYVCTYFGLFLMKIYMLLIMNIQATIPLFMFFPHCRLLFFFVPQLATNRRCFFYLCFLLLRRKRETEIVLCFHFTITTILERRYASVEKLQFKGNRKKERKKTPRGELVYQTTVSTTAKTAATVICNTFTTSFVNHST